MSYVDCHVTGYTTYRLETLQISAPFEPHTPPRNCKTKKIKNKNRNNSNNSNNSKQQQH